MTTVRSVPPRNPNMTYPVITRCGIREVSGNVADNMEYRSKSDRELINDLEAKVQLLEEANRNILARIDNLYYLVYNSVSSD